MWVKENFPLRVISKQGGQVDEQTHNVIEAQQKENKLPAQSRTLPK